MNRGCQIDFYVLEDELQSPELLVCRLALMAWEHGNRIMIVVDDETQEKKLDTLMWEKPPGRFLPHKLARQPGSAPVSIGMMDELEEGVADVIINLTREAVPSPKRFQRLLEVVPSNDVQREASRKKFRAYLNLGLKPQSHQINRN